MKFEEIQSMWKNQNDDKLFDINETALHAYIRRKSKTIGNLLGFFEWTMIAANLFAGMLLVSSLFRKDPSVYNILLSAVYLLFSLYAVFRRLRRHAEEIHFEPTLLGELDRAIWQTDYLIKQERALTFRYILPLALIISITGFFDQHPFWVPALMLLLVPVSYLATRWETDKFYVPKKQDLESIRARLVTYENEG